MAILVLPVAELCYLIRETLESDVRLADVWVTGEVSNLSHPASGHLYFTLKDSQGQMRCAFFRRENARSRAVLQNGSQIVAHGRVSFYEARGDLQLYVDFVHAEGAGLLYLEYERLKEHLEEEGLFDEARKRPLPLFPRRIGVVTSPSGAVFHDICTVLRRRWPLAEVMLAPTLVQGEGSVDGVCAAIASLNDVPGIDVIIVARGGGSLEDLWTFNDERVARAIFASKLPVVSAVGHETDVTIADLVADVRAPTPSAAAELVAPDRADIAARLLGAASDLSTLLQERVLGSRRDLRRCEEALVRRIPDVAPLRARVDERRRWAEEYVRRGLRERLAALGGDYARLHTLSPLSTLARGYAVVSRGGNGSVVMSADQVVTGETLDIALADGRLRATTIE